METAPFDRSYIGLMTSLPTGKQRSKHDLQLVELFDVEYYDNLEMWVRDHSRSMKMVPFESMGTASRRP